jgi:hypothetical protein
MSGRILSVLLCFCVIIVRAPGVQPNKSTGHSSRRQLRFRAKFLPIPESHSIILPVYVLFCAQGSCMD